MYKHKLRADDQFFGKNIPLPGKSSVILPQALRVGSHLGGLCLDLEATSPITLSAQSTLTVRLLDSAQKDGPFTPHPVSALLETGLDALSFEKGDTLLSLVLPDGQAFIKMQIETDDENASGSLSASLNYLAR